MAFDLSKFNFIKRLDARSRIFVLVASLIGIIFLVYLLTLFFAGGGDEAGGSRVAAVPVGPSIQGRTGQTPEYAAAIRKLNEQAAQQAQMTGTSSVFTMTNTGDQGQCIICEDKDSNVKDKINDWIKQGKITPEVGAALQQLADRNVPVSEYADYLNQLVKEGKLTPEQARELLEQYKKQHANNLLRQSGTSMDGLIKAGNLPVGVANQLLEAQKNNVSASDYAGMLQDLVGQGKITQSVAQELLGQYAQQRNNEIINQSIASLRQLAREGKLVPEVEAALIDLEKRTVPVDTYNAALQKFISDGKMIPAVADKILTEYKMQKASMGPAGSINQMLQQAEAAAYAEINDLLKTKQITEEVAIQLRDMIQKNISLDDFKNAVNSLMQQGKLTPEIAKLKIADYQSIKGLRDLSQRLADLQGNNASSSDFADALRKAVQAGILTPEQAAELMREYEASLSKGPAPTTGTAGTSEFAKLQEQLQTTAPVEVPKEEFATAQVQGQEETDQARQERLNALVGLMSNQAKDLIGAWQPVSMAHREGSPDTKNGKLGPNAGRSATGGPGGKGPAEPDLPVLIKMGTILFGVLDTAVDSDYPDSPVMVTIVMGKLKGAKLLGKVVTTKGVAGQMDRVSLNFTLMDMDSWPKTKTISAFAIDPDTARTVLASDVNYHYLQRYGAIMATSFLQGYANAIAQSGSTTATGFFGTQTSHPQLSPRQKLATAFGQIGQNLASVTQNYVNIPPTVKVDSGVSLGILFMADVT